MPKDLVLKKGCLAYLDTIQSGLVPCKVLEITPAPKAEPGVMQFKLTLGGIDTAVKTKVQVTKDNGPYKKGEILEDDAAHTVPQKAIYTKEYHIWIKGYRIELN